MSIFVGSFSVHKSSIVNADYLSLIPFFDNLCSQVCLLFCVQIIKQALIGFNTHKTLSVLKLIKRILHPALLGGVFCFRAEGILEGLLDLLKLSCFFACCGRDLAKILDLVVDLLKYIPMICRKVTHEIRVGEEIIADKLGGKLGVNIGILYVLVKLRKSVTSALTAF